jgi:anaerobic magnesium-protoporphyrin IX monomethyl ester cyclase
MAKLLFVHDSPFEYPGVLILYGYLKSKGHTVDLLIKSCEGKNFWPKAKEFNPDWVGFSTIAGLHHESYKLAVEFKERMGSRTVFGGPYTSYYPQAVERPEVDVVIRGEAEEALVDFLDTFDRGEDYTHLPNVWSKVNGAVLSNPVRSLETNLDKYPIPDRGIYYKYSILKNTTQKQFMSGRGCPHNCYFCFNQEFRTMYGVKGRELLRRHSPGRMIAELAECKSKYLMKQVFFNDDIFIYDPHWLEEFLPLYKKEINIPFICQVRANMVNEHNAELLGKHCCTHVAMGIESGNPRVRNEILGKNVSNEQILKAADTLHRHGIGIKAYNMLGGPSETLAEAFDTMELNAKAKIDFPWAAFYTPHPGTRTDAIAREMGYLDPSFTMEDMGKSIFKKSLLKQPEIHLVERVQKCFYFGVRYPKLIPLIKRLVHYNLGPIYTLIFMAGQFLRFLRECGNDFFYVIWLSIKYYRNF